jgi:hypothetical protein
LLSARPLVVAAAETAEIRRTDLLFQEGILAVVAGWEEMKRMPDYCCDSGFVHLLLGERRGSCCGRHYPRWESIRAGRCGPTHCRDYCCSAEMMMLSCGCRCHSVHYYRRRDHHRRPTNRFDS